MAEPSPKEILDRLCELKLRDREVEQALGLPIGFLCKARKGQNRGKKAEESWKKLGEALADFERELAAPAATAPLASSDDASLARGEVPPELENSFKQAKSAEELLEVGRRIADDTARGLIDPRLSEVLQGWSRELRQVFETAAAERARNTYAQAAMLLTKEEVEVIRKFRESITPPSIRPDEPAPPPVS